MFKSILIKIVFEVVVSLRLLNVAIDVLNFVTELNIHNLQRLKIQNLVRPFYVGHVA